MRRPRPKNTTIIPPRKKLRRYHPVDLNPPTEELENPDWLVGAN